eukprot:365011-Chlamydomonas_euryale.AAC.32
MSRGLPPADAPAPSAAEKNPLPPLPPLPPPAPPRCMPHIAAGSGSGEGAPAPAPTVSRANSPACSC